MPVTSQRFEPVLTVHDWWDGPRAGIAHFHGEPHMYLSAWVEAADDWSPIYTLSTIDAPTLALALEDFAIWCRWRIAHDEGRVATNSGPALPNDMARSSELKGHLEGLFLVPRPVVAHARPEFRRRADADRRIDPYGLEVHWNVDPEAGSSGAV